MNIKKYLPFIVIAGFALTVISIWLGWFTTEGEDALNLWEWSKDANEDSVRYIYLALALVGTGAAAAAAFLKGSIQKYSSIAAVALAVVVLAYGVYYQTSQASDLEELSGGYLEVGMGVGFYLSTLGLLASVVAGAVSISPKMKEIKKSK